MRIPGVLKAVEEWWVFEVTYREHVELKEGWGRKREEWQYLIREEDPAEGIMMEKVGKADEIWIERSHVIKRKESSAFCNCLFSVNSSLDSKHRVDSKHGCSPCLTNDEHSVGHRVVLVCFGWLNGGITSRVTTAIVDWVKQAKDWVFPLGGSRKCEERTI